MPDRDQSISPPPSALTALPVPPLPSPSLPPPAPPSPPPTWVEASGFRETFLMQLEPDEAEALREAGHHLYDLACERGRRDAPESFLRMTLRAVLADLRHLEGLLGHVAHDLVGCDLDPNDARLLTFAARVVLELHSTTEAIDGEIGPSPPAPAPSGTSR
jgi:hypothetical protein